MSITGSAVLIILYLIFVLFLLKIFLHSKRRKCTSKRKMTGKIVIVTGGNSGIGLETARGLCRRGAKVILGCRRPEAGSAAAKDIIASTGNSNVLVRQLDLSSLESVRTFAEDIIKNEQRLDVLINNAGMIGSSSRQVTNEGFEVQFVTNYLGPFLLTNLLLPLLKKSAPSRIVVVSSTLHKRGKINFDNLNAEKYYSQNQIYSDTKLANLLFVQKMSSNLRRTGVTINALHPGIISTNLTQHLPRWQRLSFALLKVFIFPFLRSAKEGSETSVYLAVSEDVEDISGKYFVDCKESKTSKSACDEGVASKLWEISERLTGLTKDI